MQANRKESSSPLSLALFSKKTPEETTTVKSRTSHQRVMSGLLRNEYKPPQKVTEDNNKNNKEDDEESAASSTKSCRTKTSRSKQTMESSITTQRSNALLSSTTLISKYKPVIYDAEDSDEENTTFSISTSSAYVQVAKQLQLLTEKRKPSDRRNSRGRRRHRESLCGAVVNHTYSKGVLMVFYLVCMLMTIDKFAIIFHNALTKSNDGALLANNQQPWEESPAASPEEQEWILASQLQSKKQLLMQEKTQQQSHYKFDLPPPMKHMDKKSIQTLRSAQKINTEMTTSTMSSSTAKNSTATLYDCLYDVDIDTIYNIENMKLPTYVTSFNIRIIMNDKPSGNAHIVSSDDYYSNSSQQLIFSFPNGFGGKELISGQVVMTVKDFEDRLLLHTNTNGIMKDSHPMAMIEEYIEDQIPTLDDNIDITACAQSENPVAPPSSSPAEMNLVPVPMPKESPRISPILYERFPRSFEEPPKPVEETPKSVKGFSSNAKNDTLILDTIRQYDKKTDSAHGPWKECLGWATEDCQDLITALVPDRPKFQYYAVTWNPFRQGIEEIAGNSRIEGGLAAEDDRTLDGSAKTHEQWEEKYNEDEGAWTIVGQTAANGKINGQKANTPNYQRVVIMVNDDNIVINEPLRG